MTNELIKNHPPDNLAKSYEHYLFRRTISDAPFWQFIISRFIPENKNTRILDLGCGPGTSMFYLGRNGYNNTLGVDVSLDSVNSAKTLGINNILKLDIFAFIKSQDKNYDVILLIDVLEHFNKDDINLLLEKCKSRLSPGGRIIIHTPNAQGLLGHRIFYGDLSHKTFFTPETLSNILSHSGFSNIKCLEDRPIVHSLISAFRYVIWRIAVEIFRFLSWIIAAKKPDIVSDNFFVIAYK